MEFAKLVGGVDLDTDLRKEITGCCKTSRRQGNG